MQSRRPCMATRNAVPLFIALFVPFLACALAFWSPASRAGDYAQTVIFGDSLSDAGTFAPFVGPDQGRFTTNPGPVWVEVLADRLGTSAAPAATTAGGTNFAAGGATVASSPGFPPALPTSAAPPVRDQITAYLASTGGRADPSALYTVWAGANDIFFMLSALPADPAPALLAATSDLAGEIARLRAAGARVIVVPNIPDIGATPFGTSLGPTDAAGVTALSAGYNRLLFANLAAGGIEVVPLDTFGLLNEVIAAPARYGLVNVTLPACGAVSSLLCVPTDWIAPNADQTFLFADGVHPTTAGHLILADYAWSVLLAPAQMSLLAETPLRTRQAWLTGWHRSLASAPDNTASGWWARAEGGELKINGDASVAEITGHPAGVTVGVDLFSGSSGRYGVAFGAMRYAADLTEGRGEFTQREATLSLYHRYRDGAFAVSTIGGLTALDFDTTRRFALGSSTTREVAGDTSGSNLWLSTAARYTWGERLQHGPQIGLTLQSLHVDGFRESQAAGASTALGYLRQERRSALATLAYSVQAPAGRVTPWAEVGGAYELNDDDGEVTAYLQSMPANDFTLPGIALGRGYGYVQAGFDIALQNLRIDLAAYSVFGHDRLRQQALQVGVRVPF